MGHIIPMVLLICSFNILSIPLLLLFFNYFTAFRISSSVNGLLIVSLLSIKLLCSNISVSSISFELIFLKKIE